ncbi:hypothetical protein [Pseudoalteromonas piscicida]
MKTYNQYSILITLLSVALLGCGQSEREADTNEMTKHISQVVTNNFEPDPVLLSSTALTSKHLHVKPEFTFKTSRTVKLDLSGNDVFGASLASKAVKVYALKDQINQYDEQANTQKSLLATTRFDTSGQLGLDLDIPSHFKTLLISVDGMLEENHLIVPIESGVNVTHQFN